MPDPAVLAEFPSPADRWLAEFLSRRTSLYRSSPEYRRQLNSERAPLFARTNHPRLAA